MIKDLAISSFHIKWKKIKKFKYLEIWISNTKMNVFQIADYGYRCLIIRYSSSPVKTLEIAVVPIIRW